MGLRIVVVASGRGSNFAAIADAVRDGRLARCELVGLLSDKADAPVLELARARSIPVHLVLASQFRREGKLDRAEYERSLVLTLETLKPDLICLAGYMRLLGKPVIERFKGKILNIHPSLLPAFKGLRAQKQALDAGVKETGCTVHFVTEEMDAGPIVARRALAILPNDTEETLSQRLLGLEHETYVEALKALSAQK